MDQSPPPTTTIAPPSLAPLTGEFDEHPILERGRRFVTRHFERLLVVFLVATLLVINFYIEHRTAFLAFYQLPVIVAGFLVGRKMAVWAALFVVLLVAFIQAVHGMNGVPGLQGDEVFALAPWGGFLILTGYVVGGLAEQRRARTEDVRSTYLAMLELLTIHVDSADRMRRGHSYRVGERAAVLARELGLDEQQQENLRVAGLLHEIGPRDPRLAHVMTELAGGTSTRFRSMRSALRLVEEYSRYHEVVSTGWRVDDTRTSIGAKVLAVADAYETLQTPTPTRQAFAPWTALEEIERGAGATFATEVVAALRRVSQIERAESPDRSSQAGLKLA